MAQDLEGDARHLAKGMVIHHQQSLVEAKRFYDKALLAMAGGALVLSMGYVADITGGAATRSPNCLLWAWILLGTCVVIQLAAIRFLSFSYVSLTLQCLDALQLLHPSKRAKKDRKWPLVGRIIAQVASFSTFVLGLVFFAVFVLHNLPPAAAP